MLPWNMSLYDLSPGEMAPDVVNVVVEIPKGTRNKIEYQPSEGVFRLDRVLYSPVHYPGDYGFIPGTLSRDGDALDALVLVTDRTFTGCVLSARPIGVLEMRDEMGYDEKILTVPDKDPRFEEIRDIGHLPDHLLTEVRYFFEVYKDLEGKETALLGWHPKKAAFERIRQAIDHYAGLRSI